MKEGTEGHEGREMRDIGRTVKGGKKEDGGRE